MLNDLRYAVRQFARARGFTAVAVLTLAVGIGANTALFAFGNAILGRPLPEIRQPERLVWVTPTSAGGRALMMSYPAFTEYRALTNVFSDASAMADAQFSIATKTEPVRVRGQLVSGSYFDVLGVQMALGRGFLPEEDRTSGTHPVAVISHRFWRERLAADSAVIGRTAKINGRAYTIVGVTPERFNGLDHSERRDVWVPLAMAGTSAQSQQGILTQRGTWWLRVVARLAPNASMPAVNAAVSTQAARTLSADTTDRETIGARVFAVRNGMSPNDANDVYPVAMLAGAVTLLVLLIACANVSNLLLGRAVARRREIAVRISLGASRRRVLRQLLTESVLLAAMGTAIGCLFASWATDILASIIPAPIDVSPDMRVLGFTIVAAFFTGLGFGVVPALHATRADITMALKDATVGFDRNRSRLQRSFVVAQVSLSLVLLVMAGMFLTALYKSSRLDVHFDASSRVLAASFDLGLQGYTTERGDGFVNELRRRVAALPGVEAVTITNQVPMGERLIGADVAVERGAEPPRQFGESRGLEVYQSEIRPGYFRVLGIPLAAGRDFTEDDGPGNTRVAIVSEDFARAAWPDSPAIGKRVSVTGPDGQYLTVVGVAREALTMGVSERSRPLVYVAQRQNPRVHDLTILVRSRGDATTLAAPLRQILREMDADMPVYGVQSLAQYRSDRASETRLGSTLLAIFGTLALLLATIGVYAVMAFSVNQRAREIGVRVALGAAHKQIVGLFLGEGARLAAIGVVVGLGLAAIAARLLSSVFFGLSMSDSITFAAGAVLLYGAGLSASFFPARRATRVDPMTALRAE